MFNAYLSQPQQWNRYPYAINNPLLYVDPDGETIQLSNDKDERERQLQALREMVGSSAAAYLYANQGSDGNWYVGIYDLNPNGDTRSFEQVNEVAGELGAIVRDKEIATLEFVRRGTTVTDDSGDSRRITEARRGSNDSPAVTGYFKGRPTIKMLDWSKHSLGYLPGELMSDRKDWLTASVMVGHELGHARARMTGYRDTRGNRPAREGSLRLENKVRKLQDLMPFLFWTIPLSVLIGLVKTGLVAVLRMRSSVVNHAVSGIVGIVVGVLWTFLVASWLGPFFGAFSFEVLTCWIVGGASGLIIAWNGTVRSLPVSVGIISTIWFSALIADRPILRLLSDARQVEVIAVKWKPGSNSLSNPPILGMKLSDADLERLKSIGLTGQVEFASSGVFGEGKRGKAIIVMSEPLTQPATLSQPDGGEVVYLQTPEGWKMYPSSAATLGRNIQLWPDEREPERVTRYFVENADGTRQGGTLVTW